MRSLAISLIASLSIADLADLQAAEPQVRPALIGNGPKALINVIDTNKLMEKGQGNGLLYFQTAVDASGVAVSPLTYRATPGSEVLEKEVMSALGRCRFIPAIYDGKRTKVLLIGTVLFLVADGKPHLRTFANQNRGDIAKWNDLIAPQMVVPNPSRVGLPTEVQTELQKARSYHQKGVAQLAITVDANGNRKSIKVVYEDPVGFNFGRVALRLLSGLKYVPGFRNGHPVESTFDQYMWFQM
jgi:hypothetical protein